VTHQRKGSRKLGRIGANRRNNCNCFHIERVKAGHRLGALLRPSEQQNLENGLTWSGWRHFAQVDELDFCALYCPASKSLSTFTGFVKDREILLVGQRTAKYLTNFISTKTENPIRPSFSNIVAPDEII